MMNGDRQNADNGLQQNITQEAQNRQNADTVLQNNIDNEKETRIAQGYRLVLSFSGRPEPPGVRDILPAPAVPHEWIPDSP